MGDRRRLRGWQALPRALPGAGSILPLGEKKAGGGEGGGYHILWSPFPGTVCAQAGLAAARALQNSGPVESVSFGKVHFAQEPRKTEDSAAGTLKPRASCDSQQGGGRRAELRAGSALPWAQAPSGARPLGRPAPGPLLGQRVCCGQHPQLASSGLRPPPTPLACSLEKRFCP